MLSIGNCLDTIENKSAKYDQDVDFSKEDKMVNIKFSSGPCSKSKAWKPVFTNVIGRSHRSEMGLKRIQYMMLLIRDILKIPEDYYLGLIAASSTGAMESLLWSLVGELGVDLVSACTFSKIWADDVADQLAISDVRRIESPFGTLTGLDKVDFSHDVVFCWTGTTAGISVNNADWIAADRRGLTICDASSAVFCGSIDWFKLDATAFSFQKGLGGEAGLGAIVLGPRAIKRLQTYIPQHRPIPRIYMLASNCEVNFGIFEGKTINTPSMITVEDYINILEWAKSLGGLSTLISKVEENYQYMKQFEASQNVFKFYVKDEKVRARNVLCFDIQTEEYRKLSEAEKWDYLKARVQKLENDGVACDILGHILTHPHIRVWCGPTIDVEDLKRLTESVLRYFNE